VPISAVDTITLAFQHTKRQLIQPFRFWQWTRLAIVGLLAGEMGSGGGGGFNFPSGFNPQHRSPSQHFLGTEFPHIDPTILVVLISIIVVAALVFGLVLMYVGSVMRFILFDGVLTKECHIRDGWARRQGPGWNYFLWQLGFTICSMLAFLVLIGGPIAIAFGLGWFRAPQEHIAGLIIGGILVFLLFVAAMIVVSLVYVFTKDFVIPQMALEGISALEGWRRLWPMVEGELSGYAIYVGMKIVLAIGAGIVVGIASFILLLFIAVPSAVVVVGAVIAGKGAGLTWNVFTITAAVVAGCIVLAIFMYVIALISVPVIVFFPAYAMYFFAPRYRPLSLALYPPPPSSGSVPPPEVPLLNPTPAPA